ncbi:DNA recombination protein RmuC [[Haemophilus] ducreyi]|uniref:DNA recombination protein RmuC n=1 Tax=Haemophilus ducreyi TaxID=730 RepID=UPI0006564C7C|nr:recombinase RmuC [[Haemophilus] ducreyi]AKO46392.1 recombinase RmuC [[Haemophilus] ducreyi]AKO47737.1 recombinase RmuC [[Haemophilus] ducreyi]AKO49119.1 recombinase RmuC [[Haemophilus] ducreyi]OOS03070.1 recombinase RmuC [[Haemophilus] ducreyi]
MMVIEVMWLYIALGGLSAIAVYLFFLKSRYQRDAFELQQDLIKAETDTVESNQKLDQLMQEKNQVEHWNIQYKTQLQASVERITEKDNQINRLQTKIEEYEQQQHQQHQYTHALKERMGSLQTKADNVEEQLAHQQQSLLQKNQENQSLIQEIRQTSNELTELRTTLQEKQANFETQQRNFIEVKQQLNVEFQHLAQQILDEKSKSFIQTNQLSLDALLKPFKEQIDGFQKRVNEMHSESVKGNTNLEAEIKRVLQIGISMSTEAQNLTTALKGNNKVVGNWGEMQLESALQAAGLLANEHYVAQENFRDQTGKRFTPDFVIHLPDNKHLIIDSKVSLLAYDQAVRSEEKLAINQALTEHCKSLRIHIDGLSKKNYSSLPKVSSPDFVLMFVPIEPAYIEAMKQDPQLFNYGYERNVVLVSHTTLMPILRTVANLWRTERSNIEAQEISEKAGDIYNQVCMIAERLNKLGNTLNTVNTQYNQTVTALAGRQGLVGKVERFQQLSNKANQIIPKVDMLSNDFETNKLTLIAERVEETNEDQPN